MLSADEFAQVIRCDRCTMAMDPNLARSATNVPQPGFIGKNYAARRIMLVGQNPGESRERLEDRDEPYMEALRQLGRAPSAETLTLYQAVVRAYAEDWPITRAHFPLQRCGLSLDDIAYCNVVRCRTSKDAAPGPRLVGACVSSHFKEWLDRLEPRLVVFIGRWAADRGAAACAQRDVEYVWLSRQRNLPRDDRENGITAVVDAVRRAAAVPPS